jgi:FAD:protein FMN transferase
VRRRPAPGWRAATRPRDQPVRRARDPYVRLAGVGVATSGIGKRSWVDPLGRPAHHLLDPSSGRPAFTGVVQATAIAPTALEAEMRAKAAVLAGPHDAAGWLPHGGLVVLDDGSVQVREPASIRADRPHFSVCA